MGKLRDGFPRGISTGLSPLVYLHWSISFGPASPTTNQDASDKALYSGAGSLNRDTGEIEQPGPLGLPGSQERRQHSLLNSSLETCCETHKMNRRILRMETPLVVKSAAKPDDSEYGDATHCRAALYKSVVEIATGYTG